MPSLRQSAIKPDFVEILFETKPEREILEELKENRFRWAIRNKCWYGRKTSLPEQYRSLPIQPVDATSSAPATEPSTAGATSATPDVHHTTEMPDGRKIDFVSAIHGVSDEAVRRRAIGLQQRLEHFREVVETDVNAKLREDYLRVNPDDADKDHYHKGGPLFHEVKVSVKKKYANVDVNRSGRFMVDIHTEQIHGIRGYGKVNRVSFCTLREIADFEWHERYPIRKSDKDQGIAPEKAKYKFGGFINTGSEETPTQEEPLKTPETPAVLMRFEDLTFKPEMALDPLVGTRESEYITDGKLLLIAKHTNSNAIFELMGIPDLPYNTYAKFKDKQVGSVLAKVPGGEHPEASIAGYIHSREFAYKEEVEFLVLTAGDIIVLANAHKVRLILRATKALAIHVESHDRPIAFYVGNELVAVLMPVMQDASLKAKVADYVARASAPKSKPQGPVSWKIGCKTAEKENWTYNGLRFATKEEAEAWGKDLSWRWTALHSYEVHESADAVTHRWTDGKARAIDDPETPQEALRRVVQSSPGPVFVEQPVEARKKVDIAAPPDMITAGQPCEPKGGYHSVAKGTPQVAPIKGMAPLGAVAPVKTWAQKRHDATVAINKLKGFISERQLDAVREGLRGEEKEFFVEKMIELARIVENMASTGQTNGQNDQAMVRLHYFAGGRASWYITEKDKGSADDSPEQFQSQAFGLADLFGDGGEMGYISIAEIIANNGELDFYWTPKTIADIRAKDDPVNPLPMPSIHHDEEPEAPPTPRSPIPITIGLVDDCDELLATLPRSQPVLTLVK